MATRLGAFVGDFTGTLVIGLAFLVTAFFFAAIWNWVFPVATISVFQAFIGLILTRISISFAGRMLF